MNTELEKIVHGMSDEEIDEYLRTITNMRMVRKVKVGSVVMAGKSMPEKGVVTRVVNGNGSVCGITWDGHLFYCDAGEYFVTGETIDISNIFEALK